MFRSAEIKGHVGELRWGYRSAGTVGAWTLTNGALTASVIRVDPLACAMGELTFVVQTQGEPWRWPLRNVSITDGTLTAHVVES